MTSFYRLLAVACILVILMTTGHDRTPVFRQSSCPSTQTP